MKLNLGPFVISIERRKDVPDLGALEFFGVETLTLTPHRSGMASVSKWYDLDRGTWGMQREDGSWQTGYWENGEPVPHAVEEGFGVFRDGNDK